MHLHGGGLDCPWSALKVSIMANKMLIDASHPEETRVVVTRGNRVEEFDFESASRKQLRGNIYLAKVTRVEPSLQAAFVDFGGNRHGFLAFSEIHPDYYQIPVADREALLADEAARARREEEDEENGGRRRNGGDRSENGRFDNQKRGRRDRGRNRQRSAAKDSEGGEIISAEATDLDATDLDATDLDEGGALADDQMIGESGEVFAANDDAVHASAEADASADDVETAEEASNDGEAGKTIDDADEHDDEPHEEEVIEQMGGADALEEVPSRHYYARRQYKIQEVIKRRQILLIQVVKEERGNKGAALTTYLSLAGRYSVLMPNTARGGGISRKITSGPDRKRLKEVVGDLDVPEGMGVILRTAGAARTQPEIKRDFEYLLRVWEKVRELTLQSTAPALVYEEGSLVKRAIRDLYSKDMEDIQVCGEAGFREAKDFMRMLMPSHAKMVQLYREPQPLFARYGIESQLDAMFSNSVTLRSGGYIVINQTEALVSIDVNSGRSTREHNIEDTALKTNLEAAEEVARQLRLRDLAGLIVIDFIDMEESRNNRSVERRMKDCLKDDRARIQIGRISHFGLLEMSRQRIRTGVLESSTVPCAHCGGTGFLRSTPSIALQLLRAIEDAMLRAPHHNIIVRTRTEVALYVLNHKRANLSLLEHQSGVTIQIQADEAVLGTTYFVVERGEYVESAALRPPTVMIAHAAVDDPEDDYIEEIEAEDDVSVSGDDKAADETADADEGNARKRGRRRRRGGGRDREEADVSTPVAAVADESDEADQDSADDGEPAGAATDEESQRRRRRRRRGGRRNRRDRDGAPQSGESIGLAGTLDEVEELSAAQEGVSEATPMQADSDVEPALVEPVVKPKRSRGRKAAATTEHLDPVSAEPVPEATETVAAKPKRVRKAKAAVETPEAVATQPVIDEQAAPDFTAPVVPDVVVPDVVVPEAVAPEAVVPEPAITEAKPAPRPAPAPEPEYTGPKRTGWWAKAKQALSGE